MKRLFQLKPGSMWKHYKGDVYVVKGFLRLEKDQEIYVQYESIEKKGQVVFSAKTITDPQPWARPISEFLGNVEFMSHRVWRFDCIEEAPEAGAHQPSIFVKRYGAISEVRDYFAAQLDERTHEVFVQELNKLWNNMSVEERKNFIVPSVTS